MENDAERLRPPGEQYIPNPVQYLQRAYERTIEATSEPNKWQGTTTAAGAQLSYQTPDADPNAPATPDRKSVV